MKSIKYILGVAALLLCMTSCDNFLNRPTEDSYNTDNYYSSDAACISGVNYLYNAPWYDFIRGYFKVGELMSGNMYYKDYIAYINFSVNGSDESLVNMSYSLWAEIANCSTVYQSIRDAQSDDISDDVRHQCMGECLAWKAMAYFYLVRSFGDVPLIHDNSATLAEGNYNELYKVKKEDVYEYIIMTLEEAMKLLPKQSAAGRIDYYCAEGLLAKVYLTKAGVTGTLNNEDLQKAADYSLDVIQNSGRTLMSRYEDIFRGSNNTAPESLFAWRWTMGAQWTCQNSLQSDLGIVGFDEYGDLWGGWGGPTADLMEAFGVIELDQIGDSVYVKDYPSPEARVDLDTRRKATMMMPGDVYEYFWRDKGGFDYLRAIYDDETDYGKTFSENKCQGPCGTNNVKHLYGDDADHVAEMGVSAGRMAYALATHILRLADVYLVHAEAYTLMGRGSESTAVAAYNAVHQRAIPTATPVGALDFDMIWKERRLELAHEGDRWYDFVRRAYYDAPACIAEIKAQHRNPIWNCDDLYREYYNSNTWSLTKPDGSSVIQYDSSVPAPNVTEASFVLPFPSEDVALNPHLMEDPIHVDVRATYKY